MVRFVRNPAGAPASKDAEVRTMMATESKLNGVWWALRVGLGAGAFLAGLDKFFGVLATWSMYVSPLAERLLPVSPDAFLRVAGVVEMIVGVAILTRLTRLGAWAMAAWLVAVALNLAATGHFWDLVVRDLEIALAAFALARLTEWRAATAAVARAERPVALRAQEARP
jgi:uncharacterized membrane protein YphA (DoxX/SURF4 family)